MRSKRRNFWRDQSGAISVASAIVFALCLGFAALVVDLAHLYVVKGELQRNADAAALAGARGLWPNNLNPPDPTPVSRPYVPYYSTAADRALSTATSVNNQVNGAALAAGDVTVDVGNWNYCTKVFTPVQDTTTNGVRVTARKSGVTNLFGKVLRSTPMNLTATAIAVMDAAKEVGYGTLPIAISKNFINSSDNLPINFTPDINDTGGWFTDPPDPANAKTIKDYIVNDSCPALQIGDIINLSNGQVATDIQALMDELAVHLAAGQEGWDVFLPVVDTDKFNQSQPIISFVPYRIKQIDKNHGITQGQILNMGEAGNAEPGGTNTGTMAPPKLVL